MSSGKKKLHSIIDIPDVPQVIEDDVEYALNMIKFHCGYDCIHFDNGLECPADCPILKYADIINHNRCIDEQEMLKNLGC